MRKLARTRGLLLAVPIALCFALWGQSNASERADWNRPVTPFRIIGNVYYVGASGVSSFLIASSQGLILLDGGLSETAPLIQKNVATLGFHMKDVRYLLNSHAHYDHCGGLAELKHASGAQMIASQPDAQTLSTGHQLSYGKGQSDTHFPPVAVDRIVGDGEVVQLGEIRLTAHLTPGHTKGCTTWSMPVADQGRRFQVVFYCSTTVAGNDLVGNRKYPQIVADYEHSFAELRAMPCDVFLAPHPGFFHMQEKRAQMQAGKRNAFVDPAELRQFVDDSQRAFRQELARQQGAAHSFAR